ncbi:hypothetical protein M9H77_28569 [Catharanthus roseus]|uniref:Uncharacterized protein n=1 Tax=Catharanthus roseus TaxID=4058 RepID=A0ACC0AJU7_CATRO|nr:hypothetical protein M9H77_28569 [Catharanthus roseus]
MEFSMKAVLQSTSAAAVGCSQFVAHRSFPNLAFTTRVAAAWLEPIDVAAARVARCYSRCCSCCSISVGSSSQNFRSLDLQIRTTVVSEPGKDFNFPVLLWNGGRNSRVTPDFSIPDSRSPWIWLRKASSKPSLFILVFCPEKYPECWKSEVLSEKLGDAHSCLTLHLTDNVLREIDEKDNAFEIWTKLEKPYLGKSLSNKDSLHFIHFSSSLCLLLLLHCQQAAVAPSEGTSATYVASWLLCLTARPLFFIPHPPLLLAARYLELVVASQRSPLPLVSLLLGWSRSTLQQRARCCSSCMILARSSSQNFKYALRVSFLFFSTNRSLL